MSQLVQERRPSTVPLLYQLRHEPDHTKVLWISSWYLPNACTDYDIAYNSGNPFRFLGNGFTEWEMNEDADLGWYVQV
jgi:hypothetical protein